MRQFNNSTIQQGDKLKVSKGFTLVESLVAISVFTVGVSAAIFVITQSINVSARTKNKIIAAYLAQEGIEVARSVRDRNWLAGKDSNVSGTTCQNEGTCWINGINDSDGANNLIKSGCVQYDSNYLLLPNPDCNTKPNLIFDSLSGYYIMNSSASQFQRTVTTEFIPQDTPSVGDPERLKVTSAVVCGTSCSVVLEEYLYNWK